MSENLNDWIPEIIASIVVSMFVGGALYQWTVGDGLSDTMLLIFGVTVLSALAALFGVDKLKAVFEVWGSS